MSKNYKFVFLLALIFVFGSAYVFFKSSVNVLGASTVNPGSSIQSAVDSASSGDTITVRAGTYNELVKIPKSNLTLVADGQVITKGFELTGSKIVLDGFYILNSTSRRGGIDIRGSDNTVKNNKIEGATMVGILIDGQRQLVESNEILGTLQRKTFTGECQYGSGECQCSNDADGMRFFGPGHTIRGNYIHDIYFDQNPTAHMDCFQTWNWTGDLASNIVIEGNVCQEMEVHVDESRYGCREVTGVSRAQGFMIEDGPNNITIKNNILNVYRGAMLGDSDDRLTTNHIDFSHNTFVGLIPRKLPGTANNGEYGIFINKAADITASHNIFYNIDGAVYIGPESMGGTTNYLYRKDGASITSKTGDIKGGDPQFANPDPFTLCRSSYTKTKDVVACIFAGFKPKTGSPVCGKAQGGDDIGAVPCGGSGGTLPSPTSSSSPTPIPGDAVSTGDTASDQVNANDLSVWSANYDKPLVGNQSGDFNNDGIVDGIDYVIWALNYGK